MTDEEAARLAGWDPADGEAPYVHAEPPEDDPTLGNNGIPRHPDLVEIDRAGA